MLCCDCGGSSLSVNKLGRERVDYVLYIAISDILRDIYWSSTRSDPLTASVCIFLVVAKLKVLINTNFVTGPESKILLGDFFCILHHKTLRKTVTAEKK